MAGKCDVDIYENGKLVTVLSGASDVIEAIVVEASKRSGEPIDWHYFAGRAVVKTTGDIEKAEEAVLACMPERLQ